MNRSTMPDYQPVLWLEQLLIFGLNNKYVLRVYAILFD